MKLIDDDAMALLRMTSYTTSFWFVALVVSFGLVARAGEIEAAHFSNTSCPCGKGANDGRLIPADGSIAGAGVWGLGGELELVYRASAA
jgi:hypothetical protein